MKNLKPNFLLLLDPCVLIWAITCTIHQTCKNFINKPCIFFRNWTNIYITWTTDRLAKCIWSNLLVVPVCSLVDEMAIHLIGHC